MPKWAKYTRKFVKEWENKAEFKGWLKKATDEQSANNDFKEGYCSVCNTVLRAHHGDLISHSKTSKHVFKMKSLVVKTQPKLITYGVSNVSRENKHIDIMLAIHIATHSSIRSIDHLGEMLKVFGKGSKLENLKMHRTKCSKLILNVLSPAIIEDLITDIGEIGYSLIVDESTDVSVMKYMAYCIRYFSKSTNQIQNEFLGLVVVERATAVALYDGTIEFLKLLKLNPLNLIGLGVDGASNLCGINHSLFTLLREKSPKLQLIKCVCHSLNTCSSKASEGLPSHIEFMLRESVSWFSHSPLRQIEYSRLYATINGAECKQRRLVKLCATRWLAFYNCIKVVLDQWLELKTCFQMAAQKEKCYSARTLYEMYKDNSNLVYFNFLKPILKEITDVNLQFQSNNTDITKVYSDLKFLLMSVAKRIIKPVFLRDEMCSGALIIEEIERISKALKNHLARLPLDAVDFGFAFNELANKNIVPPDSLKAVQNRRFEFLLRLCEELLKRLPHNIKTIQKLRFFDPKMVLSLIPPKFRL